MAVNRFDLSGRIAFITGSSKGIGLAIAEGLAESGAHVVLNGRNAEANEAARAKLTAAGYKADVSTFDVTDADAVSAAIDQVETDIGPIDILVNNAGIQRRAPMVDVSTDTWREVMSINLDAVFFVGQAVARRMIPRGRGKIINICSLMSELGRNTIAPYTAAKGGVKMLTKAMCTEWAAHGIQANGIGPGYIATDMNRALMDNPEFDAWVKKRTPAARWGDADDLKGAAIFLASDASRFVNGQIIYVDGGLLSTV